MTVSEPPPRSNRFRSPLKLSEVHWVKPPLVAEVRYLTWTGEGYYVRSFISGCALISQRGRSFGSCRRSRFCRCLLLEEFQTSWRNQVTSEFDRSTQGGPLGHTKSSGDRYGIRPSAGEPSRHH